MLPGIAVIGNGYWGKNLVRNFHALGALKCVCDSRTEALQEAQAQFGVDTCSSLETLWPIRKFRGGYLGTCCSALRAS
jgi:UDP-2-acetamido-3-amino-2,3-dideoxy-glucuronate N-acetyltransferase